MKKIFFSLLITGALNAQGQVPIMQTNITTPDPSYGISVLALTSYNGKLYFSGYESAVGRELFMYDGGNAPTLVYDINPGSDDGTSIMYAATMGIYNNKLYFFGKGSGSNSELWMYDGVNPPSLAEEIVSGTDGSAPNNFFVFDGKMFFSADKPSIGNELFVYDGANPPVSHNLNTGTASSDPSDFVELGGKLYFIAETQGSGRELCVYDPGTNSVIVAADIVPGSGNSSIQHLIPGYNGKIYFYANDGSYGGELFSFDGSVATRVTDVQAGSDYGMQGAPCAYNGYIYFAGYHASGETQLYKYNPTNNTATLAYLVNNSGSATVANFITYANKLYFVANDGQHGSELWVHDGNTTTMVADLRPGNLGAIASSSSIIVHNNKLYFIGNDGVNGNELYSLTDPAAGIQSVRLNGEVSVAPNPTSANAILRMSLNESTGLSIQLTDVTGKLVWEKAAGVYPKGYTDILIPIENNAAGIYFYNVTDNAGNTMSSGKLMKQ